MREDGNGGKREGEGKGGDVLHVVDFSFEISPLARIGLSFGHQKPGPKKSVPAFLKVPGGFWLAFGHSVPDPSQNAIHLFRKMDGKLQIRMRLIHPQEFSPLVIGREDNGPAPLGNPPGGLLSGESS